MKVIMMGGGTGGHLYPAIAIADEIRRRQPDAQILFLGSEDGIEMKVVPDSGYDFRVVPARWFERGEGLLMTIRELFKASVRTLEGIAVSRGIIGDFKPDFAVGTGGFVSVPGITAASGRKVPCYIHEQNAYPGLGNRMTGKRCRKIFLGFAEAADRFGDASKCVYTGNPVRSAFVDTDKRSAREKLGIAEDDFTVFAFGGSLGAETINDIAVEYAVRIAGKSGRTLLFSAGERYYDEAKNKIASRLGEIPGNVRVLPYVEDMPDFLAASDLAICRAGALSMAETESCGTPSILIPYPGAAYDHQYYNAKTLADAGGALLFRDGEKTPEEICGIVEKLADDREALEKMSENAKAAAPVNAAGRIVDEIFADLGIEN